MAETKDFFEVWAELMGNTNFHIAFPLHLRECKSCLQKFIEILEHMKQKQQP